MQLDLEKGAALDTAVCPYDHGDSHQITSLQPEPTDRRLEQDGYGIWHVRGFEEARAVLRSDKVKQAGFRAELLEKMPATMRPPILYQKGPAHHQQRRQTARFFTPRTTDREYRRLMTDFAHRVIGEFVQAGRADLSRLSMKMAVQVAARVVGLTDSLRPGMDGRIDRFLQEEPDDLSGTLNRIRQVLRTQWNLLRFLYLDVKPAIRARRRQPKEDVISHLIANEYSDTEILTECITYGAAGMATTREFISVAFWHCLAQPEWRQLMLTADKDERYQFLHELLRLEPVIGRLYRRTTAPLELTSNGRSVTIPAGALLDLHIYAVNGDEAVVGERPLQVCPGREMKAMKPRVPEFVMGFGDGSHRCPGAYIAIQETDIFLRQLLAVDGLRIEKEPTITYNETVNGYELRDFIIVIE